MQTLRFDVISCASKLYSPVLAQKKVSFSFLWTNGLVEKLKPTCTLTIAIARCRMWACMISIFSSRLLTDLLQSDCISVICEFNSSKFCAMSWTAVQFASLVFSADENCVVLDSVFSYSRIQNNFPLLLPPPTVVEAQRYIRRQMTCIVKSKSEEYLLIFRIFSVVCPFPELRGQFWWMWSGEGNPGGPVFN